MSNNNGNINDAHRQQQHYLSVDAQQQQVEDYLSLLLSELEAAKENNNKLSKTINDMQTALNNAVADNKKYIDEINHLKSVLAHNMAEDCDAENNAPRKIPRKNNNKSLNNIDTNYNCLLANIQDNNISLESLDEVNNDYTTEKPCFSGSAKVHNSPCQSSNLTTNVVNNKNNSNLPSSKNKKKIIQVIGVKIKAAKCREFSLKQNTVNAPVKIAINNPDEIAKIRDTLTSNKISFHEYKWDSEKNKCFLIRGLSGANTDDIPFIKQDLINAGLPDNISVLLITDYMRANTQLRHNALFKLIVAPEVDTNILKGIKFLDHVAVSFENYKSRSLIQCKNCQRFGHSAGGCSHEHRCVKFGKNHYRADCPRTLNKTTKLNCCNCGGEHTANNLTICKYYLQHFAHNNTIKASANVITTHNSFLANQKSVKQSLAFPSPNPNNNPLKVSTTIINTRNNNLISVEYFNY